MPDWVRALLGVGAFTGFALLVRWWLIAKVTLWSLQADENGREHALKLLRVLKPQLRRDHPVPVEPHKDELPDVPKKPSEPDGPPQRPKDPPFVGPGGDGIDEP